VGKKGKKALRFSTLHTKVSKTKAFSESHFKSRIQLLPENRLKEVIG